MLFGNMVLFLCLVNMMWSRDFFRLKLSEKSQVCPELRRGTYAQYKLIMSTMQIESQSDTN